MKTQNMGERFEDVLSNIKIAERSVSSVITEIPEVLPRIIPQNPNIVREDSSQTITNTYHVVINMGTHEQNHRNYPDSCGCNRGCDTGIVAFKKISSGVATPKTTAEKAVVGSMIAVIAYAGWQFAKFLISKGVL